MAEAVIVAGARTPIGKLSGALAGFTAMDLGGFAIAEALTRAGVSPDQVDYVLMGQVILAGQGQITARQAAVKGGIPMSRPGQHHQQGLPLRPQHHLPGRPDDPGRGRRNRRGRRHGVDDPGAAPPAGRPCRLPHRRCHLGRLHDVRRPHRLLRPHRHGAVHRAAQRQGRHHPRPRRTPSRRPATRRLRPRPRRVVWPRRSSRSRFPSARATRSWSTPTKVCAPGPRPSRWER